MSNFATSLGEASTLVQTYLEDLQQSLVSPAFIPAFPQALADLTNQLSASVARYSGFQATYSEAQMNRQVELLRGLSRASAVSNMTRQDFYSAAISTSFAESETIRTQLPQVQAVVDAKHPVQTGGLT